MELIKHVPTKWDLRFLELAKIVSTWSKDPDTKVGSVIVNYNNSIISTGYNGIPRRVNDDILERHIKPEKYLWYEHSERNCCDDAASRGIPLQGNILYCSIAFPCVECAKSIIQCGINQVVTYHFDLPKTKTGNWRDTMIISLQMFEEARVYVKLV